MNGERLGRRWKMNNTEKAEIILQELRKFIDIELEKNEKWYLYGIKNGLNEIEIQELDNKKKPMSCNSKA